MLPHVLDYVKPDSRSVGPTCIGTQPDAGGGVGSHFGGVHRMTENERLASNAFTEKGRLTGRLSKLTSFYGESITPAAFGLAFAMCWCYSSQRMACNSMDGAFQVWQYIGMAAGAFLIAAVARMRGQSARWGRDTLTVCFACVLVVAPLVVLPGPWASSPLAFSLVAALDGAVFSWVAMAWSTFYSRIGVRQALMCVCGMLVVSSATKVLYDAFAHGIFGAVALAALPIASILCLMSARSAQLSANQGEKSVACRPIVFNAGNIGVLKNIFVSVALIVLGVAMSMSIVRDVFGLPLVHRLASQAATIVIAIAMLVGSYRQPDQAGDAVRLWFTAVLVIASGLAAGILFGVPLGHLSSAIFTTAQMLVIGFMWYVLSDIAQRSDTPADAVFGLGWGALFSIPMAAGLVLPRVLPLALDAVSLAVVVLWMLLVALAFMHQHQSPELRLFAEFAPSLSKGEERQPERLAEIADRFGLTAREADIMGLYAQGRSRAFISAQLVISENTVRDHLKNIYRKLDVHNKQELIDLIEGR